MDEQDEPIYLVPNLPLLGELQRFRLAEELELREKLVKEEQNHRTHNHS